MSFSISKILSDAQHEVFKLEKQVANMNLTDKGMLDIFISDMSLILIEYIIALT